MDVTLSQNVNNHAHLRLAPSRINNNQTITIHTNSLGGCNCTSCFYFFLSILLIVLGTFITLAAFGVGGDNTLFSNLGHMWSVGPICVCCGMMMALKSLLYLRSKRDLQMLLPERAISLSMQMLFHLEEERRLRIIEELRRNPDNPRISCSDHHHVYALVEDIVVQRHQLNRTSDALEPSQIFRSRPPAYDSVMRPDVEAPPPTYEEAIALITQHKSISEIQTQEVSVSA